MSGELPEDPRGWPDDPFAILGVPPNADDDAIRRAYSRLLRRFKPEHHPEAFRKLRAAYESCRQQAQWNRGWTPPDEPAEPMPIEPARPDDYELAWNGAIDGHRAEAYAVLAKSDRPDRAVRLYWLLALDPSLDAERSRHHWLARHLEESRLRSGLELYRRELELNPSEHFDGPYAKLLETDAAFTDVLALARIRLAVAGAEKMLNVIEMDLRLVKERLTFDGEAGWLALVATAAGWAASPYHNSLWDFCTRELAAFEHRALHEGYWFDRVDEFDAYSKQFPASWPNGFLQFVHAGLVGHVPENPRALRRALKEIAEKPLQYLDRFDIHRELDGPALTDLAWRLLSYAAPRSEPEFPEELIRTRARAALGSHRDDTHKLQRIAILRLLVSERIHPQEFAEACFLSPDGQLRRYAGLASEDVSLQIVWLAMVICSNEAI